MKYLSFRFEFIGKLLIRVVDCRKMNATPPNNQADGQHQ